MSPLWRCSFSIWPTWVRQLIRMTFQWSKNYIWYQYITFNAYSQLPFLLTSTKIAQVLPPVTCLVCDVINPYQLIMDLEFCTLCCLEAKFFGVTECKSTLSIYQQWIYLSYKVLLQITYSSGWNRKKHQVIFII